MEDIIGEEARPPVKLRSLLEDFKWMLNNEPKCHTEEDIQKTMNLQDHDSRFKELEEKCSLEHLEQEDDVRVSTYVPGLTELSRCTIIQIPENAMKLQTFKTILNVKKNVHNQNPFIRTRHSYRAVQIPNSRSIDDCRTIDICSDLLIYIRIYRQARATHAGQCLEKPVFAEEFQCLGSNLLTELRDKISCVCNGKRFFEISENPTADPIPKTTDPAYFFITDTFYNDKRNSENADYSEIIRKWAKTAEGLKKLNFKVAKMEETHFLDLTVSLGFPQLYQHHGNCEHVFIFSQIEAITPSVAKSLPPPDQFPLLTSFCAFNNRMCNMCGRRSYVFMVEQSDRQLHDPAYLCNKCFFGFHYVNGKKIGDFKAYKVNDYDDDYETDEEEQNKKRTTKTKRLKRQRDAREEDDDQSTSKPNRSKLQPNDRNSDHSNDSHKEKEDDHCTSDQTRSKLQSSESDEEDEDNQRASEPSCSNQQLSESDEMEEFNMDIEVKSEAEYLEL